MRASLIVLLALLAGGPAFAQSAAPAGAQVRIVGTVAAADASSLTIDAREGGKATLALEPATPVSTTVKKSLADIQLGDYVGATTIVGKDGRHRATEVRIFPKDRVPNLSQFPLEWAPDNIMTNAAVAEVIKTVEGTVLKVKFPAGETDVIVNGDTAILASGPGSQALLKPGVSVTVVAVKAADGALTARRIAVN